MNKTTDLTYRGSILVKLTAIICLTIICITALLHGIDSVLAGSICGVIGGIAGYEVGRYIRVKRVEEGGE